MSLVYTALAAGLLAAVASCVVAAPATLPPHPRLLISAADVPALRARAEKTPWAERYYADLKRRGDAWLARKIELPARGGQWWHWYACPKHGARLRTESPTRHVCPVDGEVFTGYPYDDVILSARHDELAVAARDLGLLYQVSGDKRYAEKAREILMDYAERYLSYPLHDINGKERVGGGRVLPQTLDESIWPISMAQGADMIWDTLSPADIETLKTKLFYPAAVDVIQKHKMGVHNIQCWKNSAVGLVGFLFGDSALIDDAIDNPNQGFRAQMAKGVHTDGAWYEGAWGYHFYTMDALHDLTEAAYHCGVNLYGDPYKRMFAAPLDLAMPDGSLPAFNDSDRASARGNANYEIAYARYKDPRFAEPLAGSARQSLQAFVSGADTLPEPPSEVEPSRNFAASGYAVLRSGKGRQAAWLCLKYGPHGGGHGHFDKNSFVLYARGKVLAGDPGTAAYGVPIQGGWYRTTLAHNTITEDESNQMPVTGACLDFQIGGGWSGALTDAGEALPGASFRRAAFLLGSDLVVFLDLVRAADGTEHTFDLAYHPQGVWAATPPGGSASPDDKPGYSYLRDLRSAEQTTGLKLAVSDRGGESAGKRWVVFAAGDPTTYLTGTGVGDNSEDRVPIVIARRKSAATIYAWCASLQAAESAPTIEAVPVSAQQGATLAPGEAAAAKVTYGGVSWLVVANPEGRAIKAGAWRGHDKLAVTRLVG